MISNKPFIVNLIFVDSTVSNRPNTNFCSGSFAKVPLSKVSHGGEDSMRRVEIVRLVFGPDYIFTQQLTVRKLIQRFQSGLNDCFHIRSNPCWCLYPTIRSVVFADVFNVPLFPNSLGDLQNKICQISKFQFWC